MKKTKIISLFLIVVWASAAVVGQKNTKVSLIITECQKYIPDVWCEQQTVETVAYHFENGSLKNREVLMTGELYPFEFRFPSDNEYIHQNRYLISDGGDVYDYDQRKIIFRNAGGGISTNTGNEVIQNLGTVKAVGDQLIVRLAVSNASATNREGFFSYDFRSNKFNKIRNYESFPRLEAKNFSPNDKTIAVIERMNLVFYAVEKNLHFRKLRTVNLGYRAPTDKYADESEDVSVVWVDANNVLTVNKAGSIIKVNRNGKSFPVLKPKKIDNDGKLIEISKDKFGNFSLYPCNENKNTCLINLQTRRIEKIDCPPLGNDFNAALEKQKSNPDYWQYDFFYKSKSLGKARSCYDASTSGEYLAVEYKDRGYDRQPKAGVMVWNAVKKDWTNIEIKWHPKKFIIGWIQGK